MNIVHCALQKCTFLSVSVSFFFFFFFLHVGIDQDIMFTFEDISV